MFANNRTDKLTTLKLYDTNSKATTGYVAINGILYGKKMRNQFVPNIIILDKLKLRKVTKDKDIVTLR